MSDAQQLVAVMNQVADVLRSRPEADDTLTKITLTAREVVPGADEASISVSASGASGGIQTLAPTSALVCRADDLQYELNEGPCVDALKAEQTMRSEDLATDDQWRRYGPQAAALGFHCQLAVPIKDSSESRAALNLYSRSQRAFEHSGHIAELLATHASVAMGFSRSIDTLKAALATRNVISKAIGIVMQRYGFTEDQAFGFLVRVSQSRNVKLRLVAEELLRERNSQKTGLTKPAISGH